MKTIRFRVALFRFTDRSGYFTATADAHPEADSVETDECFVSWLTDWQEAEIPEDS